MAKSGTLCHCWRIVLLPAPSAIATAASGTTITRQAYGFTDHDAPLTFDGLTYQASSGFTTSAIESNLGLKIDNLEVEGALSSDRLSEQAISKGRFDGAEVYIYRVNWRDLNQRVLLRRSSIGEIRRTAWGFVVELRGLAHRLTSRQGRLYQKFCDADFGDQRCKVNLRTHTHQATITAIREDQLSLSTTSLTAFASGWFSEGKLVFLSGANQDASFDVREHRKQGAVIEFELWHRPTQSMAVGDRFSVSAGCDKSFATCRLKFNNHLNFQGFPHTPTNDHVHAYP